MIIKKLLLTSLFVLTIYAQDFKVSSYNVENLFDLKYDKTEYQEYIPNKKSNWNKKIYTIKLQNIAKVINALDSDIVALQEIESLKALTDLLQYLPQYKYKSFVKNAQSSIGLAVISKYQIIKTNSINIKSNKKYTRPIQEVTFNINNSKFIIYNNHWRSKRAAESERIEYALSLQKYLTNTKTDYDYILLGDFNSNYDEFRTFRNDGKLNNTYGITGINQVLNTTIDKKFITKNNILSFHENVHYNLWLEKNISSRFSYKYKGNNDTPDNILLSNKLFDNKNISYINNSFEVFKPTYLLENNIIKRWKTKGKDRIHLGVGYSDHLPISAKFSTKTKFNKTKTNRKDNTFISNLYDVEDIENIIKLYNVIVIYKDKSNAIIKQKNNRAIYLYKEAKDLKLGYVYDIEVQKIKNYNGLKEIIKIKKTILKNNYLDYKSLYLNATSIDISDYKYQNEIITNLNAVYKKGYLYYKFKNQNKKIKLYAKDISLLPKNGQKVNIMTGHLGYYKSKPQIIIYKESDIVN